jgi:cytokinin dehydrogenase
MLNGMPNISLPLEGPILTEDLALNRAADDYGHILHHQPLAVIQPHSVEDLQKAIRYARKRGLYIAPRGQGHSTYGQAQANGGIVLDMSYLSRIRAIDHESAWIEGGCTWTALVERSISEGLTPPTLTDYLGLSVGGTLSVGGVGGASFRHGTQTDNVLELEVVTGAGDFMHCSKTTNSELFDAMRAGLGQCGVIVSSRIRLVPAPAEVRILECVYADARSLMQTQLALAQSDAVDYLDGTIMADGAGGQRCVLSIAVTSGADFDPPTSGLLEVTRRDCTYLEFAHRVQAYVNHLIQSGLWDIPHPWLDLFLPASSSVEFVSKAIEDLTEPHLGMVLTYVLCRSRCHTPLMALPDEEWIFLVDVLRNSSREHVDTYLARNTALCTEAAELGAGVYPIGAMPSLDWGKLFPAKDRLASDKRRFDPDSIMTPGQPFGTTASR